MITHILEVFTIHALVMVGVLDVVLPIPFADAHEAIQIASVVVFSILANIV